VRGRRLPLRANALIVAVTTIGLAAAGVTTAAIAEQSSPDGVQPAGIAWGPCEDPLLLEAGGECGFLRVPLDHSRPDGDQIELAVSRIKHKVADADYQGVMFSNPGGPGVSGLTLPVLGQSVPKHAGDAYDWIGFDPRGVGSSRPSLSCDPDYFAGPRPEYVPRTGELERVWLERTRGYAAACGARGGDLLKHATTVDTVKDIERIRTALGVDQINYFGFSYGTYLGQVYATLFPQRMRRMVLDSNVDHRKVWYQAGLSQNSAFEPVMQLWFGWVARYDSVYHLGRSAHAVEQLWYAEQARLVKAPAGGVVGPAELSDVFLVAGYAQSLWPDLTEALRAWVHDRNATPIVDWYNSVDGGGDNTFAMYHAVQCTDAQWPSDWAQWRKDSWRSHRDAPFAAWNNNWFNAPCLYWPAEPKTPVRVDGRRAGAVLLIDETLDAATPFEGSLEARRRFPRASLIAVTGGTTHVNSLVGNACVDDPIADYLLTGVLPHRQPGDGADVSCDPLPPPVPNGSAGVAKASPDELLARRPWIVPRG
jgi:pimeloyl-ACP methyl ester carboxylesterase